MVYAAFWADSIRGSKLVTTQRRFVSIVFGALLVGVLAASVVLYAVDGYPWTRRVLFFPRFGTIQIDGEERYLPKRATLEENVELFLKELVLGPKEHGHLRLFPPEVRIESVLLRDRVLYVNLSEDALFKKGSVPLNVDEMVQAAGNNVLFNFRNLKDVYIFVDGQIPANVAEPLQYSLRMVR